MYTLFDNWHKWGIFCLYILHVFEQRNVFHNSEWSSFLENSKTIWVSVLNWNDQCAGNFLCDQWFKICLRVFSEGVKLQFFRLLLLSLLCDGSISSNVKLMHHISEVGIMFGHVRWVLRGSWSSSQGLCHSTDIGSDVPTAQPNQLDTQLFHGPCEFLYFTARTLPSYQVVWESVLTWITNNTKPNSTGLYDWQKNWLRTKFLVVLFLSWLDAMHALLWNTNKCGTLALEQKIKHFSSSYIKM